MEIKKIEDWGLGINTPLIIAGPCSAETEEQVLSTLNGIASNPKVNMLRAGIWKPRTRPNSFEGIGEEGLKWMQKAKEIHQLPITTEVATPEHVEACLKHDVDVLWIGARTTVNPFAVQAIADALKGVDIPVMVKNPINPDLQLWIGALERLNNAGIDKLAAIHRGFSSFEESPYRNAPKWEIPIELKRLTGIEIICDPSHIGGKRATIGMIAQKALDLDMNGLMIETHINPDEAWSDAAQQLNPVGLLDVLATLSYRSRTSDNEEFTNQLSILRTKIDEIDEDLIHRIAARMQIAEQIGKYKKDNNVTILQVNRWEEIVNKRVQEGANLNLSPEFMKGLLQIIHEESIRRQNEIMNKSGSEIKS